MNPNERFLWAAAGLYFAMTAVSMIRLLVRNRRLARKNVELEIALEVALDRDVEPMPFPARRR